MKSRLICMMLVVVLLLSVAATAMAGAWSMVLFNPSSEITIASCTHLRTAGSDRTNLWKIRITSYSEPCQGDGVFLNCYESENRTRAGNGFNVTDTQLHRGGWKNGYYPDNINYSPAGRLRENEPHRVELGGGFGSQES